MKAFVIVGLALLLALAIRFCNRHDMKAQINFADRLYQASMLTAAGRDELLRRMQQNELKLTRTDPFTGMRQEIFGTNRASILNFCAEAFQTEMMYRMPTLESSDLFIAGEAADSKQQQAVQQKFTDELQQYAGDTAAMLRHRYEQLPARCRIEDAIPAEDSLPTGGWTIYPPLGGPLTSTGLHHWISERRSVWGKTRTRTAHDLLAVGLLDQATYDELQKQLHTSPNLTEFMVCAAAATVMQRRETSAQDQAQQQQWLRKLEQTHQLSATQRQRLARETPLSQVTSLFEAVGYCERGCIIGLHQLPRQPQALYPVLFQRVQMLLPDFRYSGLSVTTHEQVERPTLTRQDVTIRFEANGRTYRNTFWQAYFRDGAALDTTEGAQVASEFHRSINQWLADQQSPLRLYQAHTPDARSVYGSERLGLLALTEGQRQLWGTNGSLLSQESHDNRFSSSGIEHLLATYQQLGLFAHLSAAEIAAGRRKALAGQKTSLAEILTAFPRMLYVSDGETAIPPTPYAALTRELAALSRGGFVPTQVLDEFGLTYPSTPTVLFGFTLGRKAYRARLQVKSDWMDSEATDLINRALREQHGPGEFYACLDGEGLIFLTPRQYTMLHQAQPDLFETPHDGAEELAF
ncbi:hypothetical protein GCM10022409_34210 [Hymenobacter glaciei]|uniref:Uncharacterized protein n=1 Tax=Hymenobacter glaciei TaxID=877209 RepID=A0ABP7UK09_9BACT